jgi:3-oxoacyl-[acyl-carrier protein] reductase
MDLKLKNKVALITAPTQGIGKSIAVLLAKNKVKCILVSRNEKKLKALKKKLDKCVKNNEYFVCDLKKNNELKKFMDFLKKKKCPDFLIHNIGGTLNQKKPTVDYLNWLEVLNFNAGIAIKLNNELIPRMKKKNNYKIIHISSISALSLRGSAPYACSKNFLNSYVTTLARHLANRKIVVSALLPGSLLEKGGHWDWVKKNKPEIVSDFLRHHQAIGRFGKAAEIAPWVLFMCSEYATSFSTGTLINLDGGTM